MTKRLLIGITGIVLFTAGCRDDKTLSASNVSQRTTTSIEALLGNAGGAADSLSQNQTLSSMGSALSNVSGVLETMGLVTSTAPAAQGIRAKGTRMLRALQTQPTSGENGFDAAAAEIKDFLETKIFIDANVEESGDGYAVFLIPGAALCESQQCDLVCDAYSCVESNCAPVVDAACAESIDTIEVRIKATAVGSDGVDLALLIGPTKLEPVVLQLRPDSIATEVELADVMQAIERIAELNGEPLTDMPSVFEGRLRVALMVHGEQDVEVEAGVVHAVHVVAAGTYGDIDIQVAAANPLWSLRADGIAQYVSFLVDAGEVNVALPYAEITGDMLSTGTFAVHIGGLSYALTLEAGATSLSITDIGFGATDSTVKLNNTTLFSGSLNADSGRTLALAVTPDTLHDSALFEVTPGLDLRLGFFLAAIAADFTTPPEAFLLDETYRIALTGAGSASILPRGEDLLAGFPGGIEVVSGSLSISSTPGTGSPVEVIVPEGQCLVGVDVLPDGAHALLGHLAVSACP